MANQRCSGVLVNQNSRSSPCSDKVTIDRLVLSIRCMRPSYYRRTSASRARLGDVPECATLTAHYHNLPRMWAET